MARIEKITVFCDGPCGGDEISGDPTNFILRTGSGENRSVDLCGACAAPLLMVYDKGTVLRPGRRTTAAPAEKKVLAKTAGGQVEPVEPVVPVDETPRVTLGTPAPTPVVEAVVKADPFDVPAGTGV